MSKTPISSPRRVLMPSATVRRASMSRPESVSSRTATDGLEGGAEEVDHRHAGDGRGVLHGEEEAAAGALVRPQRRHVLALEIDVAGGDLVARVAHEGVGERALAGAVRPHDGVHLAG